MGQIEELRMLVSARLNAVTSEIFEVVSKIVANYEEQASRLKEENERHRSLLDIILKTKPANTKAVHASKTVSAVTDGPPSFAVDSKMKSTASGTIFTSSIGSQTVFTTREDFEKYVSRSACPFCLKTVEASESHLIKRHYLSAIHFIQGGTKKFVIPCMCKDKIQNRSHWHCPYCRKIIYRRCNFEAHLSKQHSFTIVQQSQDAETHQLPASVLEVQVPIIPEHWCYQNLGSAEQQEVKVEVQRGIYGQDQHAQQILIQNCNSETEEQSQVQDSALDIKNITLGHCVQETTEICPAGRLLPEASDPTGENQIPAGKGATTEAANSASSEGSETAQNPASGLNGERRVERTPSTFNLDRKKAVARLSASQNPTGSHVCRACGKSFHYMYTLNTHVLTHAWDKAGICGICGKHLGKRESLLHHVQKHNKRNRCRTCGKEFSSVSRLKRHKKFHLPKGLNVMSPA
ncbi:uncharacterized protein ACNS7B_013015 isoform 1-T1 [Menidia menidia]